MKSYAMELNYKKAFRRIIILFVVLAVITAVAIPLSLSQQISDAATLRQQYENSEHDRYDDDDEHEHHHEDAWKSQITPLSAANYAIIGSLGVLWVVLVLAYWLTVIAWLYRSAVNAGMNRSLWPILGIFLNVFAAMLFCIVRDRPAARRS